MKISRQDEAKLPAFDSHENAREYFKDKYGDNFVMADSKIIGNDKIYFYHLILDSQRYYDGFNKLREDSIIVDSLDFMNSYQTVELFEDGRIHVIH